MAVIAKPQPEASSQRHCPCVPRAAESTDGDGHSVDTGNSEDQEITDGSPELNKLKLGATCYGQG